MYTLLVVAVLLALLFDTAAATSPAMDPTMPAPIEPFYPDPEGMLTAICELCGISMETCVHALTYHPQCAPFTPETFYEHPEWPQDTFAVLEPEPELAPISYFTEDERRPLFGEIVRQLDQNATTIQPSTVQSHVLDTYTPGDRLAETTSRRTPHKRLPTRRAGFPCTSVGCGKTFNRSCDLKRHQKRHLDRAERPHKCSFCNEGFLYPKDRNRHQRTHDESSLQTQLYCTVPGCTDVHGFSRRDNLLRHQRRQHPHMSP